MCTTFMKNIINTREELKIRLCSLTKLEKLSDEKIVKYVNTLQWIYF